MSARRVERLDVVRVLVELAATIVSVATARAARRERRCQSWPRVIVWRSATRRLAAVAEQLGDRMDSIDDEIRSLEVAAVLADRADPLHTEWTEAGLDNLDSELQMLTAAPAARPARLVLDREALIRFLGPHGLGDSDPVAQADHVLQTLGVAR